MRKVFWQRVDEASAQPKPEGWNILDMQEVFAFAELHEALIDAGQLAPSAELHIQRPGRVVAYQPLKTGDQVPTGELFVKVVAPPPGVYSVLLVTGLGLVTKPLMVQIRVAVVKKDVHSSLRDPMEHGKALLKVHCCNIHEVTCAWLLRISFACCMPDFATSSVHHYGLIRKTAMMH